MIGQEQATAVKFGNLTWARGKVGLLYPLSTPEMESSHAQNLANNTLSLTKANTAFCGDDRPIIALANGEKDTATLSAIVVPQMLGGEGLSVAKALVAAESPIVAGAKDIWDAYEMTNKHLAEIGEEDAGHDDCGASGSVEKSVANSTHPDLLMPILKAFMPQASEALPTLSNSNWTRRNNLLSAGFYGNWDIQKHKDFLIAKFPENFSYLQVDENDQETHGHHGSSIYVVTGEGVGFAKNKFIEETGQEAFSVTIPKMFSLAHRLGGSDEERLRIASAFIEDTVDVSVGLVDSSMPIFVQPQS
jgi:hypothetical protein